MAESLHNVLNELAKSDLRAAGILTNNGFYPQAIYFYSQAFEKAAKSAIALYLSRYEKKSESETFHILRKDFKHELMKLTTKIVQIFIDSDKRLYMERGGEENDWLIQIANESIEKIKGHAQDKTALLAYYENAVNAIYRSYRNFREPSVNELPHFKALRQIHNNPKTRFLKFNTLANFLFIVLDGMDIYSRYPMDDIGYNNIAFLSRPEIRGACLSLGEMINELISLVPLVWKRIESLETSN